MIQIAKSVARLGIKGANLGETASSMDGGTSGLSDAFASTFTWVDKLGMSAEAGLNRVFRQTLVGDDSIVHYGLFSISKGIDLPNPDAYVSLLWRQLIGNKVSFR